MKLFYRSSVGVAVLMGIASLLGLVAPDVYRDNQLVEASWRGNDLVTLAVAVPLLVAGIRRTRQGSSRGLLVSLGLLAYAGYGYAFYLFGAAFNSLFLLYVGVLALSTLGLIGGLSSDRLRRHVERIDVEHRDRQVGWLVTTIALFLGLFWVVTSAQYVLTGRVPAMVAATDHPTNVTGALDLWLVVTFGLLGGIWLATGKAWGFVIAAVWTVKGAVYMAALSAASVSAFLAGATDSLAQLALWLPIEVACLVGALILLRTRGPADSDT